MHRPSTARSGLREALRRHFPGLGYLRAGRRTTGLFYLSYTLFCLGVLLLSFERVRDGFGSLALSLFLLVDDVVPNSVLFRLEVTEHWAASLFLVAMPVVLWALSRRGLRTLDERGEDRERGQWSMAWEVFRRNRIASAALAVITLLYTVAILSPVIAPYAPEAFQDGEVTKFQPPLGNVTVLRLRHPRRAEVAPESIALRVAHRSAFAMLMRINRRLSEDDLNYEQAVNAWRIEQSDVLATVGLELRTIPIADLQDADPALFVATRLHLLGTDSYGRDLLSRIIYGSRVSLSLGFVAVLLSVTLGTLVGLFAGYFGRMTDSLLMRFTDILLAFPTLFLILITIATLEKVAIPRIFLIVCVLGLTSWMGISRLVRAEVLSLRDRDFVLAARALGLGPLRILFRHILPNTLTPIIVNATLRIGGIILVEAALSYLNVGVQQPTPSWGNIIFEGKDFLGDAWWISTLPGLAIVLVVVCFNLVGDGLRDAVDPMLTGVRR